nr:hypothetical protein [Moritella viscosa]SHO14721.1 Amino acid adenylation domain protein [Moritella viscosa]
MDNHKDLNLFFAILVTTLLVSCVFFDFKKAENIEIFKENEEIVYSKIVEKITKETIDNLSAEGVICYEDISKVIYKIKRKSQYHKYRDYEQELKNFDHVEGDVLHGDFYDVDDFTNCDYQEAYRSSYFLYPIMQKASKEMIKYLEEIDKEKSFKVSLAMIEETIEDYKNIRIISNIYDYSMDIITENRLVYAEENMLSDIVNKKLKQEISCNGDLTGSCEEKGEIWFEVTIESIKERIDYLKKIKRKYSLEGFYYKDFLENYYDNLLYDIERYKYKVGERKKDEELKQQLEEKQAWEAERPKRTEEKMNELTKEVAELKALVKKLEEQ